LILVGNAPRVSEQLDRLVTDLEFPGLQLFPLNGHWLPSGLSSVQAVSAYWPVAARNPDPTHE
jgi:hypothetical protein